MIKGPPVAPDGRQFVGLADDGTMRLYPVGEGPVREVPGLRSDEVPLSFTTDGNALFVAGPGLPLRIDRLDIRTGRRAHWAELMPPEVGGATPNASFAASITPDGRVIAWSPGRLLDTLFVAEGL